MRLVWWAWFAHHILAACGGLGVPSSRRPANSGPSSLAALVKVESRVLSDSKMKMMFVTEKRPAEKPEGHTQRVLVLQTSEQGGL